MISRRVGAISIHFLCLLITLRILHTFIFYNPWLFNLNFPKVVKVPSKDDPSRFEPNLISPYFDIRMVVFNTKYFVKNYFHNFTSFYVPLPALVENCKLLTIVLLIDVSFNIIDSIFMFFMKNGFSATFNPLLLFHHWIILWIESSFFNLYLVGNEIETIEYNTGINIRGGRYNTNTSNSKIINYTTFCWFTSIIVFILVFATIMDLLLAPSTAINTVFENSRIRKVEFFIFTYHISHITSHKSHIMIFVFFVCFY